MALKAVGSTPITYPGLRKMLGYILDLIFPQTCVVCGNELSKQEQEICLSCLFGIEQTHYHRDSESNGLYLRFVGKVPIQKAACCFFFDTKGSLQKALHALKYNDTPKVGLELGRFYGSLLQDSDFLNGITALLPVPLHKNKLSKRGYNQAEKIATGISLATKIPVNASALIRTQAAESQTKKSKIERWENVSNAFLCQEDLSGQHIALIDDVITTGSTLISAAQACLAFDLKISILGIATPRPF